MRVSGAQAVVKTLVALGAERIFGIPGAQNVELFDAFLDENVEIVLVTHEASAAFMADATGRLTGKPGIAAVVPGPGLTNSLTGLAEAYQDSVPVLLIAAGIREGLPYRYQLHEVPQLDVARPIAKAVFPLRTIEEIPRVTAEAYRTALEGEPGPVVLELPSDLAMERGAVEFHLDSSHAARPSRPAPNREDVVEMARLVRSARRVGIYAGQGAFGATDLLERLAERLGAPVATTITGRGAIPEDHELAVGYGFGPSGQPAAEKAFAACDLVFAIGCRFSEVGTGSYGMRQPGKLVHVDIEPSVAGKNYEPDLFVAADARETLSALLDELGSYTREADRSMKEAIRMSKEAVAKEALGRAMKERRVSPDRFFTCLRKVANRDAILAVDSGNHLFWAISHFPIYGSRTFLAPVDYQSMGYGTPAAIAACLAHPGRQVLGVVGDGCFLMTGNEIVTAARNGLPVVIFVFNDGGLGIIGQIQRKLYARESSVRLTNPDYEKLAAAYGLAYHRIGGDPEVEEKLSRILPAKEPTLVNVLVEYDRPTQYFVGASKANLRHLGLSQILLIALRTIKRRIFGPPEASARIR